MEVKGNWFWPHRVPGDSANPLASYLKEQPKQPGQRVTCWNWNDSVFFSFLSQEFRGQQCALLFCCGLTPLLKPEIQRLTTWELTLHPGDAEVCSAWLGSPSSGRNVLHLLIERISPRLFPVVRQGWRYKTFPSHIIEILKIFLLGLLDDAEFGSWQSAWPFFHSIPIDEVIGREAYNYKLFASEGEPCLFKPLVCP